MGAGEQLAVRGDERGAVVNISPGLIAEEVRAQNRRVTRERELIHACERAIVGAKEEGTCRGIQKKIHRLRAALKRSERVADADLYAKRAHKIAGAANRYA